MFIIREEYDFSPRLHVLCIDLILFLEAEGDHEDYLVLTQYCDFGMDHQYLRCFEDHQEFLGAYGDPNLEKLGRNDGTVLTVNNIQL